ncbi:hypothetical protein [Herbaspirillum sp. ST 5-3]|uniref:hypothetical protein n=1 Tax=Oxalobacteraceae TaxID=75682 RepID=UPI0010A344A3|nr:hypothetical protein [Herbaspirillum sp. ST 5-3]
MGTRYHSESKRESQVMGMLDSFRRSGGGVQEKSSAWNPFVSHTVAQVTNKPQVVRDGQTRPQLPIDESEKSRFAGAIRAAYHSTETKKWHLELAPSKKNKQGDNFVQTLSHKDAYLKIVQNDTYFSRDTGSHLDRAALAGVLRATQASLPRSADAPPEIAGAELVVLAQAAALASRYQLDGTENPIAIADAARGLSCLQNLDLLASIRDPEGRGSPPGSDSPEELVVSCPRGVGIGAGAGSTIGHDNDQFDSKDVDCAWRIASVLEATPLGFATLKKLTRSNPPSHPVHPSVEKHDDVMLHVYLKAAREKMKEARAENRQINPDPRNINSYHGGDNDLAGPARLTLLDKALLAAREHLVASDMHARNEAEATKPFRFDPTKSQAPVHEWAVAAVRNGIYSDKRVDERGELTQFGKIEEQLEKMDLWVNRASGRNDDGTPETKWDRVVRGIKQFYRPRHYRSPLNAYKRLAPGIKKKSGVSFGNPEEGGVGDAREFRDSLIRNLEAGLKSLGGSNWIYTDMDAHGEEQKGEDAWRLTNRRGALFGSSEDGSRMIIQVDQERPDLRTLKSAARLAILEQFREETVFLPRYLHGDKLDDGAMEKALERVSGFLDGGLESQSEIVQADLRSYLRAENRPLTPELLAEWAADVGGPKTIDDAVKLASGNSSQNIRALEPGEPDWRAFGKAMDRVVNGNVDRVETKPLTGLPKDEIGAIFEELVRHEELGSTTTLASGGTSGVGFSGLVGSVITAAHTAFLWMTALLVRPSARADFRADKHDTMTIGPNPEGTELFLGRQKIKGVSGGANLAVGPGFDVGEGVGAAVGVSVGAGLSWGKETREGVTIRFPRMDTGVAGEVKEGLDIDPENNEKLGRLTRKLINQCKEPEGSPKAYINAPGEEDSKSLLKNIWQEWPEVSINYAGMNDDRHGHDWNVGLGGGFAFGPLRAGLGPVAGRVTTHSDLKSIETGGALHVDTYSVGTTKKVRVGGSIGFTAIKNVFKKIGAGIAGGDVNLAQAVPSADLASVGATIHRKGTAERFTWIKQDGELKKESYRQITYQDADSFVDAVKPDMDIWAEAKAFKFSKTKFHASTSSANGSPLSPEEATKQLIERAAAIETERRKNSEHLQSAKDNPDPWKNFLAFYEFRDDALKTANALNSVADMALRMGDEATAKQCRETSDQLLRNEHSYEPAFLVDVQVGYETKTKGINILLIRQQQDTIIRTNLHTFT